MENKVFPWLETSNSFTYGITPPEMKGNRFLLTGTHDAHYQFAIDTEKKWWQTSISPECCKSPRASNSNETLFAAIELKTIEVERLGISDRVGLLSEIIRGASLARLQQVGLIMTREIMIGKVFSSLRMPRSDSYSLIWMINCTVNEENLRESVAGVKRVIEIVCLMMKEWNWFIIGLPICGRVSHRRRRETFVEQKPYKVMKTLPQIKINANQIMNWLVPLKYFASLPFSHELEIYVVEDETRTPLLRHSISWIKFSSATNAIRFNPTSADMGVVTLHICTKGASKIESCAAIEVTVTSLQPQRQQIFIRDQKDPYIINYSLPLAWFRSFGKIKEGDIQISVADASVPIVCEGSNRLRLLSMVSLESTVLELRVNVVIKNSSLIPLQLYLPIMALNVTKVSGYVFNSTIKLRSMTKNESRPILYHFANVLEGIAHSISGMLSEEQIITKVKVLVLKLYKERFVSNEFPDDILVFDWTFSWNSEHPNMCILPLGILKMRLLNISLPCCNIVDIAYHSNVHLSGCGPPSTHSMRDKIASFSSTMSSGPYFLSTKVPSSKSVSVKLSELPKMDLRVDCGRPFKFLLPPIIGRTTNLKMLPVGKLEDWLNVTSDRKNLVGVIQIRSCRNRHVLIRMVGSVPTGNSTIQLDISILIVSLNNSQNHKFQIEFSFIPDNAIDAELLYRLIISMEEFLRKACTKNDDCAFNLSLLEYKIENGNHLNVSIGVHEDSRVCKDALAIFLQTSLVDKTHLRTDLPSAPLKAMFQKVNLGQLTRCTLIMRGPCKNNPIYPPDLGQQVAYNNILKIISLRPFQTYLNRTLTFKIADSSMKFSSWITISPDSNSMFILATTEHISLQPYIIKLDVEPSTSTALLLPKIALEVRNLMQHPLFYPYIRELNHQISVDITTPQIVVDTYLFIEITIELCQLVDHKLRPLCNASSIDDCGTDILIYLNSAKELNDGNQLNYKLSSLRVLKGTGFFDPRDSKKQQVKCPLDALNQMESVLKLQALHRNYSWTMESTKVSKLGPCMYDKTSYLRTRVTEERIQKNPEEGKIIKTYIENSQQIFLVATVIPACSFIIITLFLGMATACFLQYRRRRKLMQYALKSRIATPVICLSDLDAYYPPSKPLILRHEKPPEPIPTYDEILITNVHALKYRSTI